MSLPTGFSLKSEKGERTQLNDLGSDSRQRNNAPNRTALQPLADTSSTFWGLCFNCCFHSNQHVTTTPPLV